MFLKQPELLFIYLIFFLPVASVAQTCTGSLGDPIVNITFGAGPNFGSALPASTTSSLQYQAATCPVDGSYSILNYTSGCWPNDVVWHTATDHTGDKDGYYMLVNASYQPSNFYIQTINGLCEGTTYQFAAWLLNMCSVEGILPNITMTIEKADGTILATYNTGDVPIINPVTWKQYGFDFTTPAGVSTVVLRMRNNAPGGVGNDVGLDDITFRPTGPGINVNISGVTKDTVQLCSYNTDVLHFVSTVEQCYSSTAYQWQVSKDNGASWTNIPNAITTTYTRLPTAPGTYLYRLAVAQAANIGISTCRVVSTPIMVVVQAAIPLINIKKSICKGGSYFGYTTSGTYTDTFTSSTGCDSTRTVVLTVNSGAATKVNMAICQGQSYGSYTATGTYIDTLATVNGCDSVRTLHLTVYPNYAISVDTTICYGNSFEGYTASGTYTQQLKTGNGCDSVRTINLTVIPPLHPDLGINTFFCTGDSLVLSPGGFTSYTWQDGSSGSSFIVKQPGIYSVTVTNRCGSATATTTVEERRCDIYFPTAFTPNDDGRNDLFKALNPFHLKYYHLLVYNRWGQKVFETTDYTKGWNGKIKGQPAPAGTFVWYCELQKSDNSNKVKMRGTVTIIR